MESQKSEAGKSNVPIIMLGLDEAGKTTLLYKLKLGNECDLKTIPTIGFNVENIEFEDKNYTFWDIGGGDTVRVLWKFYVENKAAVVFVIDASNAIRLGEAKEFLHTIMSHEDCNNVGLLVISNKHDKAICLTDDELKEKLDLKSVKQSTRIIKTNAYDPHSLINIMVQLKELAS